MQSKPHVEKPDLSALLAKLHGVKETGRETGHKGWLARCPAHSDRSPSLALRQTSDGTILIHCFAGCDIRGITDAVGIDTADLFPHADRHGKPIQQPLTDAERNAARNIREKRARIERQHAATAAARQWSQFSTTGSSEYCKRKGINEQGLRYGCDGGGKFAAVPKRNTAGEIVGFERLYDTPDGKGKNRKFTNKGKQAPDAHHWLGDAPGSSEIGLAEGFATAATLHETLTIPVACCFGAGNLLAVAEAIRAQYSDKSSVIFADNDETGLAKATAAAHAIKARLVVPPVKGDFNDLVDSHGTRAVIDAYSPQSWWQHRASR